MQQTYKSVLAGLALVLLTSSLWPQPLAAAPATGTVRVTVGNENGTVRKVDVPFAGIAAVAISGEVNGHNNYRCTLNFATTADPYSAFSGIDVGSLFKVIRVNERGVTDRDDPQYYDTVGYLKVMRIDHAKVEKAKAKPGYLSSGEDLTYHYYTITAYCDSIFPYSLDAAKGKTEGETYDPESDSWVKIKELPAEAMLISGDLRVGDMAVPQEDRYYQ